MSVGHADGFAALSVATALLVGLLARARGAPGQSMLTTMLNSMAHVLSEDMVEYLGRRATPAADPEMYGLSARYRLYEAADGWVFLAAPTPDDWASLVDVLAPYADLSDLDPGAASDAVLASELADVLATRSADDWARDLTEAGVGCAVVAPGPSEVALMSRDGLLARLGMVVEAEHPVIGSYPRAKPAVTFSRSRTRVEPSCRCGEHTVAVLHELGYDDARIESLRAAGVVAT
jgi:crotonobetainyl-CoA:carnitine CoA-transferase CaiB-like acyl-CoA transferase